MRMLIALVLCSMLLAAGALALDRPDADAAAGSSVLHGRVTDESGKPVENLTIVLYSGVATRWETERTVTDKDGRYRFDPLMAGAGFPGAMRPGIRIESDTWVSADGDNWWDEHIPHGETAEKDFRVQRGGWIGGKLTFGTGAWNLGRFDLRFESTDGKKPVWYAATENNGEFRSEAMYPGEYVVQWNSALGNHAEIARVTVQAGKVAEVKRNLLFSLKSEPAHE